MYGSFLQVCEELAHISFCFYCMLTICQIDQNYELKGYEINGTLMTARPREDFSIFFLLFKIKEKK